ncbi:UDP-N-acetylmuramate dehydrogenase [Candidatus Dependentiae bacterium]|nr:UDP-N-acetylmuramate dehydrogenase [Candidatus Dependentiae bacterium]
MYKSVFSELSSNFKTSYIYYDVELKNYSSMKVGGKPAALISIEEIEDLVIALQFFKNRELNIIITGKCTNMIFSNNLEKFVIISLGENFNKISVGDDSMICSAGASLQQVVRKTAEFGLSGLEWAMGIPGTIGGAIVNNSGIKNHSVNDLIEKMNVMTYSGEKNIIKPADIFPSYRTTSIKQKKNIIVIDAVFKLKKYDRISILNALNENFLIKQNTQPLKEFSAGCIFKNPAGNSAGRLIDEAGLKGYRIGGASVSVKHANFIVNDNNACFNDIIKLIELIKETVLKKFNIELELEVEIIK